MCLHDSNMGQIHTWRFLCLRLRACVRAARSLWRGVVGVGGAAAAQSEQNTQERTGSSVEALLAESVAGQISWRAVCRGCGTLQQRAWGGWATARLLSTPQFQSIYVVFPPIISLLLPLLSFSVQRRDQTRNYFPPESNRIVIWSA